jgi:hypothetical protein
LTPPVVVLIRHAIVTSGKAVEYFYSVAATDKHRYVYEFDAPADQGPTYALHPFTRRWILSPSHRP